MNFNRGLLMLPVWTMAALLIGCGDGGKPVAPPTPAAPDTTKTAGAEPAATEEGAHEVLRMVMFHDDGKGKPGEKVTVFKATNHNLHFALEVRGRWPANSAARWSFTAVDTSGGKGVKIGDIEGKLPDFGASNLNTLTSNVELPRDWPTGIYKVDVFVNGKQLHTAEFKIE